MDLSVLIPGRNEEWMARTIADVLSHAKADTEVIAVCDGGWPNPPIEDHARVRLIRTPSPIGQRAAVNLAAKVASGRYVMKLDAHCSVEDGFDRVLVDAAAELGPNVTQIPQMRNLQAFWRFCTHCHERHYQGPMNAKCEKCASTAGFRREIVWEPRKNTRTESWIFDETLHFQYANDRKVHGEIGDVMSSVGACFFMERQRFYEIGGLDESHGSWGQFGTEIACKSWLSGGRHVVNKRTWFAHLFRTQGADFSFPYPMNSGAQEAARVYSRDLWLNNKWAGQVRPLSWLVDKFLPIPEKKGVHPGWSEAAIARVREAGAKFKRAA